MLDKKLGHKEEPKLITVFVSCYRCKGFYSFKTPIPPAWSFCAYCLAPLIVIGGKEDA